jgi:hypothetical protein
MRDYVAWHQAYDDPGSDLSWRLDAVRHQLRRALDRHPGPVRVLSLCAGDGRDILEVLAGRTDAARVGVVLVELHPEIAERARRAAAGLSAPVEVRTGDAGRSDTFADAVPADIVLLVGMLGNISDPDLDRTIATTPALCRPGATVLWSRGQREPGANRTIRAAFTAAGFTELAYTSRRADDGPAVGVARYDGPPVALPAGLRLFTFIR